MRNGRHRPNGMTAANYYDALLLRLRGEGVALSDAVEQVADAYLDGKPQTAGKKRRTNRERDGLFWASLAVAECPPKAWNTEAMVLALARYLAQEPVAATGLLARVAREAPDALVRAVRYSGLVLKQHSPRRTELEQAAAGAPPLPSCVGCWTSWTVPIANAPRPLQCTRRGWPICRPLSYCSMPASTLIRISFRGTSRRRLRRASTTLASSWPGMPSATYLAWKLAGATTRSLRLTDDDITRSFVRHLRPILFAPGVANAGWAVAPLREFQALLDAQVELNDFTTRSAEAFCYADHIRFERRDDRLEIVELDKGALSAWKSDGRKLELLHNYWFYRAIEAFVAHVAADVRRWEIGRPENAEANRLAYVRALQAQLRLREVYGVADEVVSEVGDPVNIFQALLSLNLMSMFYLRDFLGVFVDGLNHTGNWIAALQQLALGGMVDGNQNRFPLTWSSRDDKVANITGWTVTESDAKGNPRMASAILDFWSYDMVAMAERFQSNDPTLQPHLFERPVLKFGAALVQLPWIVGLQNTSAAAINNLRRLGARRGEARDEARRIEATLGQLLETRGFKTLLNWEPLDEQGNPGEVDLIAVLDRYLIVFEVKSTYLRRSQKDAWRHATGALRTAGRQLQRKIEAVSRALATDPEFRVRLGLTDERMPTHCLGWIADTSIECDHQRFSGFLKVSIEELLIALRDDRHHLNDPDGLLAGNHEALRSRESAMSQATWTLYPHGFSAERFVAVIDSAAVWEVRDSARAVGQIPRSSART